MILRWTPQPDSIAGTDLFLPQDYKHIGASDRRGPEMIPFFFNAGQDIRKKAHGYRDFKIAFYLVALGAYAEAFLSLIWVFIDQTSFEMLLGKPLAFFAAGIMFTYLGRNLQDKMETETQVGRLVAVQGNEDTARQLIELEKVSGEAGRAEYQWWAGYMNRHADEIEKLRSDVKNILLNKYQVKKDLFLLHTEEPTKTGIPPAAYWLFTGKPAEEIAAEIYNQIKPDIKPSYIYTAE